MVLAILTTNGSLVLSRIMSFFSSCFGVQVLSPLPIGLAVFVVHLATIPITGTGINPARSLGTNLIYRSTTEAMDDLVRSSLTSLVHVSSCYSILGCDAVLQSHTILC